jgi:ribonuclease P protein component
LIREFFRLHKKEIPQGYDIMVIALKESDRLVFLNVQNELGGLLLNNYGIFS